VAEPVQLPGGPQLGGPAAVALHQLPFPGHRHQRGGAERAQPALASLQDQRSRSESSLYRGNTNIYTFTVNKPKEKSYPYFSFGLFTVNVLFYYSIVYYSIVYYSIVYYSIVMHMLLVF